MFDDFLKKSLLDLDALNIRRRLRVSLSPTGAFVDFDNETLHNFASNDYLGLASHPAVSEASIRAIRDFGNGSGASRLISGTQQPHALLEQQLAVFKNTEAALCFSSGYAASTGTLAAVASRNDVIFFDRLSHACLIDGARLSGATLRPFKHNDPSHLEHLLRRLRDKYPHQRVFIVTESVFSMDGDVAPLQEIVDLKRRYDATLMLDEAHAVGVLGNHGRGLADALGLSAHIDIQMGTLGKALGSAGGYIAGSRNLTDFLLSRARSFIFSTSPPPASAAAASAALSVSCSPEGDRLRNHLFSLSHALGSSLPAAIFPVVLGAEDRALAASDRLRDLGFFVPAIRPPTVPAGTSRLRVCLSASHSIEAVQALRSALDDVLAVSRLSHVDSVCPVCGSSLFHEKCKVICRSPVCNYRIVFNCSEF